MNKLSREAEILLNLIKELVSMPDDIKMIEQNDDMGVLITVSVNQEDMGKIIGREGSMSKVLRTILRCLGMRNQKRLSLKIVDPEPTGQSAKSFGTDLDEELKGI